MSNFLHPSPGRKRSRGVAALLTVVLLLAGLLQVSIAAAQDDTEAAPVTPPELLLVDTVDLDGSYVLVRSGEAPTEVGVKIGGQDAETSAPRAIAQTTLPIQTAIVIDNSGASDEYLPSFLEAASAYIANAGENEEIQVWTSGGAPRLRVGLNNDHERTGGIVDSIVTAAGGSLLYDSIRGAALELEGTGPGTTNVIVFAGAIDGGSVATASGARGAVQAADASAFAVASTETVVGAMQALVQSTYGGAFAATDVPEEIAGYGASVSQVVNSTWMIPFTSETLAENNQIALTLDDTTIRATYAPGSTSAGTALAPFVELGATGVPGFGFFDGDAGRLVGLLFGALAAGLGAFAVVQLVQKDESTLTSVLQAYNDPHSNAAAAEADEAASGNTLLKRAYELTEGLAERQGFLTRLESTLERADLPLRGGEALTAAAGIFAAFIVFGFFFTGSLPGMLVFAVMGGLFPGFFVRFKASRRQKAFMSQLPDTLNLLSSTLKAGYSFLQGVEAVSKEIEDPMGSELRRIVTEAQLGRPLEDAMDASAERMDSPDFAWAVMAVKIQREVGGNLSELLLTVADTMTERERLRRDVATLTAEGKMSAIVLGLLPMGLGAAMWAINPEYIETLFTDGLGKVLLGGSIIAALVGFAWMKKIIAIEI
ncbi:MAG: type II secretion system F family protein [Acidimicrobiales bacterium]